MHKHYSHGIRAPQSAIATLHENLGLNYPNTKPIAAIRAALQGAVTIARRYACVSVAKAFWLILLAFGPFLLAIASEAFALSPEISSVRFGTNDQKTRIVIDIDRLVRFDAWRLTDPERLVVDLPDVRWRIRPSLQMKPDGLAERLRFGEHRRGADRLVVDIGEPFEIVQTMALEPNRNTRYYRLIVDIEPIDPGFAPQIEPAAAPFLAGTFLAYPVPRPSLDADFYAAPTPPLIVLDAGHGGRDPGAIGINGVYERDITLSVARELAKKLREQDRYEVLLTRDDDRFITLPERIAIAREAGGDLFISIHADSIAKPAQRGASVYTLSETASDAEAAKLAQKENKAGLINGVELTDRDQLVTSILIDLAQRDTNNKSIEFADLLVAELGGATRLLERTRRYAGFAVLKAPDIPSVLVELGYLSNYEDAQLLSDRNHRDKVERAIVKAIDVFFETPS